MSSTVAAVGRIGEIDPDDCRRRAEHFSAEVMCRGYVEVYERLARARAPRPRMPLGAPVTERQGSAVR